MKVFSGQTADAAWRQAATYLISGRNTHRVDSRIGSTIEIMHAAVEVLDPRMRWVASRQPPLNIAFAIAEIIQLLAAKDDVQFLAHWFPQFPRYVGQGLHAAGAYGVRLRQRFGIDQLDRAARALLAKAESRQVVLSIWNPTDDLPTRGGKPRSGDVPCNVMSCLRLVEGQLHWLQTCRSNDLFRGLPYNFVQFTFLQEVMAGWVGAEVGRYTHVVSSLHFYESAMAEFRLARTVPRPPRPLDIRLPLRESRVAWRRLEQLARKLTTRPTHARPVMVAPQKATELGPLQSLFWILAAEDARRRGWHDESAEAAAHCADRALSFMWRRWCQRVSARRRRGGH